MLRPDPYRSSLDTINSPGGETIESPGTYTYQTGTSRLTHVEGTPPIDFGYDANGNITSETGWTYIYDLSNQLIRVLRNSNQVAAYTYDGAGQRIKKVTQTETRIFHYDNLGHLIAETNLSGQMLAEYVYLGDTLLAVIKPGESVYYYHNDHLGTPQVLTDDTGTIAWKAVYTPFGEAVASIQTIDNPFRFPGQYYDEETGLHYNYFRYYDPQTGRYITPDPIGLEGGINLFAYVANDPINSFDPFGFQNLRQTPEQPPVPFPGPAKPPYAPGASKPPPGSVTRFVGDTYTHLYLYTLEHFEYLGVIHLERDRKRLVDPEAAKIPCGSTQIFYFWFTIDNRGVHGQFLTKTGDQYLTRQDVQRVTIEVPGTKDCPCIYDLLPKVR